MNLPDAVSEKLDALSAEGNDLMDEENFSAAIEKWSQALEILPEPKVDWEAYTWLSASIGDAQYQQQNLGLARDSFLDALNGPDGVGNPFVHYRLGQCQFKLGKTDIAIQSLLKAYMLDGEDIFHAEEDGLMYLQLLKERNLVD